MKRWFLGAVLFVFGTTVGYLAKEYMIPKPPLPPRIMSSGVRNPVNVVHRAEEPRPAKGGSSASQ